MVSMVLKVLKNLLKRPFTSEYPKKKSKVSINFRGVIHIDQKKCISCKLCEVNCPTGAIIVDPKKKYAVVDRSLCILCGLCAEVCPVKVIWFSNDYEIAEKKKKHYKKQLPGANPVKK
ncbi:4Fe-4S binding protein [Candidatus Micrarchaeota archaeon]|nr:4Fe-4S binding protein [Candidatus Micrarchaeota archaeon]